MSTKDFKTTLPPHDQIEDESFGGWDQHAWENIYRYRNILIEGNPNSRLLSEVESFGKVSCKHLGNN
jgi:hypothetical protein